MRGIAGDLAEEVKLIDTFTHPKTVRARAAGVLEGWDGAVGSTPGRRRHGQTRRRACREARSRQLPPRLPARAHPHVSRPSAPPLQGRTSNCYRIAYRSMDRSLTDDEINALQEEVRR